MRIEEAEYVETLESALVALVERWDRYSSGSLTGFHEYISSESDGLRIAASELLAVLKIHKVVA